jgi:hypothetical protein
MDPKGNNSNLSMFSSINSAPGQSFEKSNGKAAMEFPTPTVHFVAASARISPTSAIDFASEGIFSLIEVNGSMGVLMSVERRKDRNINCTVLLYRGNVVKCSLVDAKLQVLNWLPDCPRKYGTVCSYVLDVP